MISNKLSQNEYNSYYKSYIDNASNVNIVKGLEENLDTVTTFYSSISKENLDFSYAEGKWTVKDILLHIIDTERVFVYRAMRIARKDNTPLVGFEQDDYVINGNTNTRTLESLIEEYKAVRLGTIVLFKSFDS